MTRRRRQAAPASSAHPRGVSDAELRNVLAAWLPSQRWFAGGDVEAATLTISTRLPVMADGEVLVELVLLRETGAVPGAAAYQILLGHRRQPPERLQHMAIATVRDVTLYDALHDADVTAALIRAWAADEPLGSIVVVGAAPIDGDDLLRGLVLTAEQSNTSVVFGDRVIMKFFRRLVPGRNPDAEVSQALLGCSYVPGYLGELSIMLDGEATTVALASAFIGNSADAWSLATTSVRNLLAEGDLHPDEVGGDFAAESHRLGEVIARLHRDLAAALPVESNASTNFDPEAVAAHVRADASRLARQVPELAALLAQVDDALARWEATPGDDAWAAQRIHGDLHLGQVLRTVEGWQVIDFEGEPSRSLAERRAPRSPLRDIAGMLRSFDYAARQPLYESTVNPQRAYRSEEWLARNRSSFLDGYAQAYGADPRDRPGLLSLFELGKAIYEVGYEHQHRPGWVKIPLDAVAALTAPD